MAKFRTPLYRYESVDEVGTGGVGIGAVGDKGRLSAVLLVGGTVYGT